jgi:hypothetical protein
MFYENNLSFSHELHSHLSPSQNDMATEVRVNTSMPFVSQSCNQPFDSIYGFPVVNANENSNFSLNISSEIEQEQKIACFSCDYLLEDWQHILSGKCDMYRFIHRLNLNDLDLLISKITHQYKKVTSEKFDDFYAKKVPVEMYKGKPAKEQVSNRVSIICVHILT